VDSPWTSRGQGVDKTAGVDGCLGRGRKKRVIDLLTEGDSSNVDLFDHFIAGAQLRKEGNQHALSVFVIAKPSRVLDAACFIIKLHNAKRFCAYIKAGFAALLVREIDQVEVDTQDLVLAGKLDGGTILLVPK